MKQISMSLNDEQINWIKKKAKSDNVSDSEFIRRLIAKEMNSYQEFSKEKELEQIKDVSLKSLEISYGLMGFTAWLIPSIAIANKNNDKLLKFFSELGSSDIYPIIQKFGEELAKEKRFLEVLRDVPIELNLDTKKFANLTKEEWQIRLTQHLNETQNQKKA